MMKSLDGEHTDKSVFMCLKKFNPDLNGFEVWMDKKEWFSKD